MDPNVDAMIVIYIPPQATKAAEIGQAIAEGIDAVGGGIPVATAWMSSKGLPVELQKSEDPDSVVRVPGTGRHLDGPRRRVRQVARATRGMRSRPSTKRATDEAFVRHRQQRSAVATRDGSRAEEVERLFGCYGLKTARLDRSENPRGGG